MCVALEWAAEGAEPLRDEQTDEETRSQRWRKARVDGCNHSPAVNKIKLMGLTESSSG